MSDDFSAIFEAPLDRLPRLDELVKATMAWHFSPDTGCPYWTSRVAVLDFDPLTDVRCADDLRLFDGVRVDWSAIPAGQLVPRGSDPSHRFGVYESGGATGPPKRIVDATSRRRNVLWQSSILDSVGFPGGPGGWLHIGPTGPHVMASNIAHLAAMRGFLSHFVDLDPRWARRCLAHGRIDQFRQYVEHILDQVRDVLSTQDIRAVSATPPILEAIATRPDVCEPLRQKVRGIIWGGTSVDAETLRLLREEVFPDAVIQGAYGNTMMGVAPQRPSREGDVAFCVFRPFFPYSLLDIVDPADPAKPVPEGVEGQVKVTTLTRDLFVPPTLERDGATRRTPVDATTTTGIEISDVRPAAAQRQIIVEGVY